MPTLPPRRRQRTRAPQIDECGAIVPIAAARQVVEEISRWFGVPLHGRYAARLAFQARRCYALSVSFRTKIRRPGDTGRDLLYVFLRHWLAARLQAEQPELYARLPKDYACGASLPALPPRSRPFVSPPKTSPGSSHGFDYSL